MAALSHLLLLACAVLSSATAAVAIPVGQWTKSDTGEAIVLDISYNSYAVQQDYYQEAVVATLAASLQLPAYAVYVTDFARSSVGTTIVFFDTVLEGSSSSSTVVLEEYVHVQARLLHPPPSSRGALTLQQALFCPASGPVVPGSPACPSFVAALQANGLPVSAAYYNEQLVASSWSAPPTPAVDASQVGTWNRLNAGEAVALNISYDHYSVNQQSYQAAFIAAVTAILNIPSDTVTVVNFKRSSAGTTVRASRLLLCSCVLTQQMTRRRFYFSTRSFGAPTRAPAPSS